jgi:hypothetical protein
MPGCALRCVAVDATDRARAQQRLMAIVANQLAIRFVRTRIRRAMEVRASAPGIAGAAVLDRAVADGQRLQFVQRSARKLWLILLVLMPFVTVPAGTHTASLPGGDVWDLSLLNRHLW